MSVSAAGGLLLLTLRNGDDREAVVALDQAGVRELGRVLVDFLRESAK